MKGRVQAIMVAAGFALLSLIFLPVNIVSLAAVALVTLRLGAREGGYIFGSTYLALLVLGSLITGSFQILLTYGLILWGSVWLSAVVLREGRHLFLAIKVVIMIAAIAVVGAYLYQPDLAKVWEAQLGGQLKPMLLRAYPDTPAEQIQQLLFICYHFVITGLLALFCVTGVLAGLFLGRGWQAALYNPGGFKKEYLALKGRPKLAIATLVIMAVAALFSSGLIAEICWNVSILLFALYAFIGTIVLHCVFMTLKQKDFMVPLLYVTMMLIPYALLSAAMIGFVDSWLNLRNKIPNQTGVEDA